jgi:hypothetical protein
MGVQETKAMDLADARYMELLETLTTNGLVDARQVFEALTAGDAAYLPRVGRRIGTAHPDKSGAWLQLAGATGQWLATTAARWAVKDSKAHAIMRAALLRQGSTERSDKEDTSFLGQAMRSDSPTELAEAALGLACKIADANLMPTKEEIQRAGLSGERARKLQSVARKAQDRAFERARQPTAEPSTQSAPVSRTGKRHAEMEEVALDLERLDVAAAQEVDAQAKARQLAAYEAGQAREKARVAIASEVTREVDSQWRDGMSGRARSETQTVRAELARRICDELLSIELGESTLASLAGKARPYSASEHRSFNQELRSRVAQEVTATQARLLQAVRAEARRAEMLAHVNPASPRIKQDPAAPRGDSVWSLPRAASAEPSRPSSATDQGRKRPYPS